MLRFVIINIEIFIFIVVECFKTRPDVYFIKKFDHSVSLSNFSKQNIFDTLIIN